MKLRQALSMGSAGLMVLMSLGGAINAQEPQTTGAAKVRAETLAQKAQTWAISGDQGDGTFMYMRSGDQTFEFDGGEFQSRFGDNKTVKGSPFSAQIVIENTQTLANGTHISHTMNGALYRDSEGRTRREMPTPNTPEMVMVTDPVAGTTIMLNVKQQTANKLMPRHFKVSTQPAGPGAAAGSIDGSGQVEVFVTRTVDGGGSLANTLPKFHSDAASADTKVARVKLDSKTESLGTQMIEGVQAEGTRSTITFPVGSEGNDQPLNIVSEKWYSADLQMVVMTKHSDPRMGDNVYRLTNINRAEPAASLFQVPSDFTVVDNGMPGEGVGGNVVLKRVAKPKQD